MREKPIRLFSEHVGELIFDGSRAVAASLDVGYPKIKRIASDSVAMYSEHTNAVCVGSSELVFEGYLLSESAAQRGASSSALWGPAAQSSAKKSLAAAERLDGMKALLMSLCAPGQEFVLEVGTRRRALYAAELTFSSEGPFGTGMAEKFRLRAFSDNAFFHGGDITFAGQAQTQLALSLPASPEFSTAVRKGVCDINVQNDGDEVCGFVMEATFAQDTLHFALFSNRDSAKMHVVTPIEAGESITISTVPGDRYIRRADGQDLISCVNSDFAFHTLAPGRTCLTLNSFSSAAPTVQGRFTPGYLMP